MMIKIDKLFILFLFCILCSCSTKAKWTPLFDGKSIDNFEKLNGEATYYVENECIVGKSKTNTPNTFLSNKKIYGDFILEFEVWADTALNSGLQFRSISNPEIMNGRVHGYQCEIESSDRKWAGGIYDEGRRGWIYSLESNPKGQEAFIRGEWNKYRIEAIGEDLRTWINGIQCAHLKDNMTSEGIIGFQVHSIHKSYKEGRLIKWRNIKILTKKPEKFRWPVQNHAPLINLNEKTKST